MNKNRFGYFRVPHLCWRRAKMHQNNWFQFWSHRSLTRVKSALSLSRTLRRRALRFRATRAPPPHAPTPNPREWRSSGLSLRGTAFGHERRQTQTYSKRGSGLRLSHVPAELVNERSCSHGIFMTSRESDMPGHRGNWCLPFCKAHFRKVRRPCVAQERWIKHEA